MGKLILNQIIIYLKGVNNLWQMMKEEEKVQVQV